MNYFDIVVEIEDIEVYSLVIFYFRELNGYFFDCMFVENYFLFINYYKIK